MLIKCSYLIILILLMILLEACKNSSPIKISEIDGHEFISCNIDKVKDTKDLHLNEIAESCEIVLLENDTIFNEEDYKLEQVTVSENYIVAMPFALLYSRSGKFIKRLGGDGSGIHSKIDKQESKVYIQVNGYSQLYIFNIKDNGFSKLDWAINYTYDFLFIDSTTLYGAIYEKEHWGYLQPINSSVAKLIPARYSNILHPYFSSVYKLLYDGDKIVLDFLRDTTYYFNPDKRSITPFLYCYSKKNVIETNRILENISKYGLEYEKMTEGLSYANKFLLYAANGFYIFAIDKKDSNRFYFLVINKKDHSSYYIDSLVNDYWGGVKIASEKAIMNHYGYNTKDGYLSYQYSVSQFKEVLNNLDFKALDEPTKNKVIQLNEKLKNEKKYCSVLFINKLRQ